MLTCFIFYFFIMKPISFLIFSVLLFISAECTASFISLKLDKQEKIIHFFNLKSGDNLLITTKQIAEIGTRTYKPIGYKTSGFKDATVFDDTLLLLKNDTLFFIPSKNHFHTSYRSVSIKTLGSTISFEHVCIDETNTIWLSSQFGGLYSITGGKLVNRLNVPVINEVKSSVDTCIWVGTNLGLYKYTKNTNNWVKYSEEALGGYDMPDNIVEHIYTDHASCAWVTMPGYISYISKGNQEKEIPSFNYIGDTQTELLDVLLLKKGYLMATNKGIIYLSKILPHVHEAGEEIHTADHSNSGIKINTNVMQTPNELLNETITFLGKGDRQLYIFTQKGFWTIPEKKLQHDIFGKTSS